MTEQNFQQSLMRAVVTLLEPVTAAVENPILRERLLAALGYDLGAVTGYDEATLDAWLGSVTAAVEGVQRLVDDPPDSIDELTAALPIAQAAVKAATTAPPILSGHVPELPAEQFGLDLLAYLVCSGLNRHAPVAYRTCILLGVIVPAEDSETSEPIPATGTPIRLPRKRAQIRFDAIGALLTDPLGALGEIYLPSGLAFGDETDRAARLLFSRIGDLLVALGIDSADGIQAIFGLDPQNAPAKLPAMGRAGVTLAGNMLSVSGVIQADDGLAATAGTFGVDLALSSPDRGGLGLVVVPRGEVRFTTPIGRRWTFGADLAGTGGAFAVGRDGVITHSGDTSAKLALEFAAVPVESGLAYLVGSATGTRLEVGSLTIGIDATLGTGRQDYGFDATATKVAFVISGGEGDGFLQRILPPKGLRIPLDTGISWHRTTGWHITGSVSLDATLPLHVTLGPLTVQTVYIALKADAGTGRIDLQLAASATATIGPVEGVIERIGVTAAIAFPAGGGNLGPADVAVAFRPPDGIGLSINAGALTGGGYLFHDADKGQYAGAVQLRFGTFALKAVGLLTTKNADGSAMTASDGGPGWSLIVVISAEFPAIQIGFGFTLNGVGGLLGINRTASVDALRAGVRNKALDSVMFPPNPVGDAPHVVATLGALFPVAAGRYLFGPMARIGWGTPTILTLDIALILELPSPVRLIVLGRLGVTLPKPDAPIVQIHLDALGIIDFDKGEASIDATIYDSKIAAFTLTGDMALRARWGHEPTFALSAGGFNPRFNPPAGFPQLRRLAIALATGDNPRLRLEAYLALTSNTVQLGAGLEVYAEAAGFSIAGMLHFDALLQMSPFQIVVDVGGSVALKRGSSTLFAISLELTLSGPTPWRAKGTASFSILFLSFSISFDLTIGHGSPPPPPPAIDVRPRVDAALADPGSWSAQLPQYGSGLVTLRALAPAAQGELLVHPLGTLQVRQREVPLGVELQHIGTSPIAGEHRFDITQVTYGASGAPTATPLTDLFAPAQFLALSDDQKLTAPSFQPMQAGLSFGTPGMSADQLPPPFIAAEYETIVIDDPDEPARPYPTPDPTTPTKPPPEHIPGPTVVTLAGHGLRTRAGRERLDELRFRGPRIPLRLDEVVP